MRGTRGAVGGGDDADASSLRPAALLWRFCLPFGLVGDAVMSP